MAVDESYAPDNDEQDVATEIPETSFWRRFVEEVFEQCHAVLNDVRGPNDDEADDLLAALRRAMRQPDLEAAGVTVWVDGAPATDPGAFLPRLVDDGFEDYLKRVARQAGEAEFAVLFANPHLHDRRLWTVARRTVRAITEHGGMACGGVDTCAFFGRYRKTPFGVHLGQMSVLTFPLIGTKRFLLWPYDYGMAHPEIQDSSNYDAHLSAAAVETARRGDILYWPAKFWHVADGSGEITAAWNIGFWWDRPVIGRVMSALADELSAHPSADSFDAPTISWPDTNAAVPAELDASLDALVQSAASHTLRERLLLDWLSFVSADGFRDVPAPAGFVVDGDEPLRVRQDAAVRALPLDGSRMAVAADGQVDVFERRPGVLRLLERADKRCTFCRSEMGDAAGLLEFLGSSGVLERAQPRS